jgi:hypothetical protein
MFVCKCLSAVATIASKNVCMHLLATTGVRCAAGKPVALKTGLYHVVADVGLTEPEELPVERLVAELQGGRRAFTMFPENGCDMPGQEHLVKDGSGALTVPPVAAKPALMLEDLPTF